MGQGNPSTRAEVGDIATAVREGADIIMLAGEVASEATDPAQVVAELRTALLTAEKSVDSRLQDFQREDFRKEFDRLLREAEPHLRQRQELEGLTTDQLEDIRWKMGMGSRICLGARARSAGAILVSVTTGETARYVSFFRPAQRIISIGASYKVAKRLLLSKGIYPVVMQYGPQHDLDDFVQIAREIHSTMEIKPVGEWKKKNRFVVPGLMRIVSKLDRERGDKLLPNTVHEFSLPHPPEGVPETEKKYILNKQYYDTVRTYLLESAKLKREMTQDNHYFYDQTGIVREHKALARIRIEQGEELSPNGGDIRILLTYKGHGRPRRGGGEQRWEKEYDITRYFANAIESGEVEIGDAAFKGLPPVFIHQIWNEFKDDFVAKGVATPTNVQFRKVAGMRNQRLRAEVQCSLVLELDHFCTKEGCNYFELEVETLPGEESRRDEYIELLFGSLGIPVVSLANYPSKFVRTMMDYGLIDPLPEWKEAIDEAMRQLSEGVSSQNRYGFPDPSQ